MERIRRNLNFANVAAGLALLFSMSGGAIAATGGFTAASRSIKACAGSNGVLKLQTGKKCKKGQKSVAWNQQGVPGAKGATGPAGPSGIAGLNGAAVPNATKAADATTATTAQIANNALALGGVPVSGFTQRSCASDTGQVKGFAQVPAKISSSFQPVEPAYNCSGGAVEARRRSEGAYEFKFDGNPAEIAVATPLVEAVAELRIAANVHAEGDGRWVAVTFQGTEYKDVGVSLVLF